MGEGFDFSAKSSASFTILLRDLLSAAASFGTMSSNNTWTPILAKWQAMRLPMTPEPRTATFLMLRFISDLFNVFTSFFSQGNDIIGCPEKFIHPFLSDLLLNLRIKITYNF